MSDYTKFYQWIKENAGQIHEHIKIDMKDERGLSTTDSIQSHTALAMIPWSLVVNNQHADLSNLDSFSDRQALVIFLIGEYLKGEESKWSPWIQLLNIDEEAKDLLVQKMNLFSAVESSTLGQALTNRYQQLQEEYEQLQQSGVIDTNLDIYCTVDHLVWSRVLDLPENEPLSLVPFIDFANHSLEANARWFIDDETHNLILRSERNLNPGEEITISYGSKSNEELLYLYGFALPNNPNDRVTVPVGLSPDDVLLEEKLQLIRELKLPPRLTFDSNGQLSEQSEQLAKILSSQTVTMFDQQHHFYAPYLLDLLNEYLEKLNMLSNEEIFIKYYLDSQKTIVEKAIEKLK